MGKKKQKKPVTKAEFDNAWENMTSSIEVIFDDSEEVVRRYIDELQLQPRQAFKDGVRAAHARMSADIIAWLKTQPLDYVPPTTDENDQGREALVVLLVSERDLQEISEANKGDDDGGD